MVLSDTKRYGAHEFSYLVNAVRYWKMLDRQTNKDFSKEIKMFV